MIQIQEKQMDEGTYFIQVQHNNDDTRVFFEGDHNCIWTYLLSLGLNDVEIEKLLEPFSNVKL